MYAGLSIAIFVLFGLFIACDAQQPPREFVKAKCEKRTKNETIVRKCKECVESFTLPEHPTKEEVKGMIKACVPRKNPKEWMKGKCEENTDIQDEISLCYQCVDKYMLPKVVTRNDVKSMRQECVPKPSMKFKAKRKCIKKLTTKEEIEQCRSCIDSYELAEKASCEEVNEMKKKCLFARNGREMWTEPLLEDDDEIEI